MDSNFAKGKQIDPSKLITVGLSWDEIPNQEIDLDLQCILLNELGQIDDAVYYNQLESKISKIKLSEDSKGEKDGFDEILLIELNSCPYYVKYVVLLICSFNGQTLSYVESSQFQVLQNNQVLHQTSIGQIGSSNSLSVLPCIFEKSYDGKWTLSSVEQAGKGKTFLDNEDLIKKGLTTIGFDQVLFEECKNWKGEKSFNLEKNRSLIIPKSLNEIQVGLGWDTRCDIDSSILLYSSDNQLLENIYYGNKKSNNGSVIHHGDNLTGDAVGDDEVITIKLNLIDEKVQTIWAIITIYSSSYQFDAVDGAFCRLFSPQHKSEFCKFNLSQNKDGVSTGNIMCCISRCQQGTWAISPKGFYVKDARVSAQVANFVSQILQNDLSKVQTIEQILQTSAIQKKIDEINKQSIQFNIHVQSASGLASFDSNGFSDPYVIIYLNGKKLDSTQSIKKNLNPIWNFKCNKILKANDKIEFQLYDHNTFSFDAYMGSCYYVITMKDFEEKCQQQTLEVLDKNGQKNSKITGTLSVKIERIN